MKKKRVSPALLKLAGAKLQRRTLVFALGHGFLDDELVERKLWDEVSPNRSVLYRFANANNLVRDPHLQQGDIVRPFEFTKFGQMWTADFMHGPKLWFSKKKRKSHLHVIIDDCTRFVVGGKFYPSESTEILIAELMAATRRFGIAQRHIT